MAPCRVCDQRILSHAKHLVCCACKYRVHLRCLHQVSITDSLYTNRDKNDWICPVCIQNALAFNHYDDDDEFIESVSESWEKDTTLPLAVIKSQNYFFSPFELNEDAELPLHDIDPDVQFYNNQCNLTIH